jgi:hypothetical protein
LPSGIEPPAGCLWLSRTAGAAGAAWRAAKIDLREHFDMTFEVYLGNDDRGGDGAAFVLQNSGSSAVGSAGGNLGLAGISPSVAVEVDVMPGGAADPSFDHLAVDLAGNLTHQGKAAVPAVSSSADIEDGQRRPAPGLEPTTIARRALRWRGASSRSRSRRLELQRFAEVCGLTGLAQRRGDAAGIPTVDCLLPQCAPQLGRPRVVAGSTAAAPR